MIMCLLSSFPVVKLTTSEVFRKATIKIEELKQKLSKKSRTSQLWLLYMDYIDVLKLFIFAERNRIGNYISLQSTGHIHYAKSARLYVQQILLHLPDTHPWLYHQFLNEQHTVKRTDKSFNGIWTDLAIAQTLMRSIKSRGGLTEGRGMTESVRHLWVLSLSHSASIHEAMMQLSKAQFLSSSQHEVLGVSRRHRD